MKLTNIAETSENFMKIGDYKSFPSEFYKNLINEMEEGYCIIEVIFDEQNKPYDYLFVEVNNAFTNEAGLKDVVGKRIKDLAPNHEQYWFDIYGNVAVTGKNIKFQNYAQELNRHFEVYAYLFGELGENLVAVIFKDITEKIKTKTELKESNEKFYSTLDNMIEGCAIVGYDWTYLYVNDANAKHAHLNRDQMIGKKIMDVIPGFEGSTFYNIYKRCLEERIPQNLESCFKFADGSEDWYEVIVNPVPEGFFILSLNITERKNTDLKLQKTLDALKENEAKLVNAQRMAKIGNVEIDLKTNILSWSDEVFDIYERPKKLGVPTFEEAIAFIHPDDDLKVKQIVQGISEESITEMDFRIILPDKKIKHLAYYMKPIFENGIQIKRIGTVQDITERKNMEKILHEKVIEKELLLRELYHRTKNNMQVISSLLSLKLTDDMDPIVRNVFEEMQGRIRSIALVHEKLYKSRNLSRLDLKEYIVDLVNLLLQSNTSSKHIVFNYDLDEVKVLIDTALSCGLILTELVQNSIKHAFPNSNNCCINISLKIKDDDMVELLVCDNGIGITDNDLFKQDKIGLQIFKSIAEDQLNAKIELNTESGTCWKLLFKDVHYKERV